MGTRARANIGVCVGIMRRINNMEEFYITT